MAREEVVAIRAMKATLRADLKVMIWPSEECCVEGCCVPPDEHTISRINGRGVELRQAEL